jgi:hypothetical protein
VYSHARLPARQHIHFEVIANRLSYRRDFSSLYTGFCQFSTVSKTGPSSEHDIQKEKGKSCVSILNWKCFIKITFNERIIEFGLHWSNITKL